MNIFIAVAILLAAPIAQSQTVLLEIDSTQNPGSIGHHAARIEDLNGDGVHDIIALGGLGTVGLVQVFSGADGQLIYSVLGSPDAPNTISLTVLDDVNQDGLQDWALIGGGVTPGTSGGFVLVHSGLDGSLLYVVRGGAGQGQFIRTISPLGDWNADGATDWAVRNYRGEVLIHSGANGALIRTIHHGGATPSFVRYMEAADDWDGDQLQDLWIWDSATPARAVLYSGDPQVGVLTTIDLSGYVGPANWQGVRGGVGDWDGDGLGDVGGWFGSHNDVFRVLSSRTGLLLAEFDSMRGQLQNIGDINGNGIDDLGSWERGTSWLFDGGTGRQSFTFIEPGYDWYRMAPYGDYNNDGINDYLVSLAPTSSGLPGVLRIVSGGPGTNPGDTCSNPIPLRRNESHAFDTRNSGQSGLSNSQPCLPVTSNDIFFSAGNEWGVEITTQGSTFDTILNTYDGRTCNSPCMNSNDDDPGGGSHSRVYVAEAENSTYHILIQVSGAGGQNGQGLIELLAAPSDCYEIPDDGFGDNHTCQDAIPISDGRHDLVAVRGESSYFTFCVPPGGTLFTSLTWAPEFYDTFVSVLTLWDVTDSNCGDLAAGTQLAGGWPTETANYLNQTNQVKRVILEVPSDDPRYLQDLDCAPYTLVVDTTLGLACPDELGNPICLGEINSLGLPTSLSGWGSQVAADNSFWLIARGLPRSMSIYFLASRGSGFVPHPAGSDGNLCLGGNQSLARLHNTFGGSTEWSHAARVDLGSIPEPPLLNTTIASGETWYFQAWYRDTTPGASNFSDGIEVLFQ